MIAPTVCPDAPDPGLVRLLSLYRQAWPADRTVEKSGSAWARTRCILKASPPGIFVANSGKPTRKGLSRGHSGVNALGDHAVESYFGTRIGRCTGSLGSPI
ncbi:hypothetical protein K788_0008402 [Paraburkholderia caribensis MBA4]|uniref:Uncharacterized protein n=1 Tax=Paraburkholderia caribensis MBA4 TaxID=1323664 RepID=A0A0P0R4R4_9BURK|nr:hypothetical protein K788_0008402 [Paraburkholderia caribensis MBA4]